MLHATCSVLLLDKLSYKYDLRSPSKRPQHCFVFQDIVWLYLTSFLWIRILISRVWFVFTSTQEARKRDWFFSCFCLVTAPCYFLFARISLFLCIKACFDLRFLYYSVFADLGCTLYRSWRHVNLVTNLDRSGRFFTAVSPLHQLQLLSLKQNRHNCTSWNPFTIRCLASLSNSSPFSRSSCLIRLCSWLVVFCFVHF